MSTRLENPKPKNEAFSRLLNWLENGDDINTSDIAKQY